MIEKDTEKKNKRVDLRNNFMMNHHLGRTILKGDHIVGASQESREIYRHEEIYGTDDLTY